MTRALFVCHSGQGVGLGHLKRSLVAASALRQRIHIETDVLIAGEKVDTKFALGFNFLYVPKHKSISNEIAHILEKKSYQIMCLDLTENLLDSKFDSIINFAAEKKIKIITIDLLSRYTKNIDLIYIPNFLPPPSKFLKDSNARVVFGWDCFLLSIENSVKTAPKKNNILILTGGSDTTNLGTFWPSQLDKFLPKNTNVKWVTGPYSMSPTLPLSPAVNFNEVNAPANLTKIMSDSRVAATVYGVSYYELLALGIPTVVFNPYQEKNTEEIEELSRLGVSLVARDYIEATDLLSSLLSDDLLQSELSLKSKELMQNYTGERFVKEVELLLMDEL